MCCAALHDVSVSYTHLDVYKRQLKGHSAEENQVSSVSGSRVSFALLGARNFLFETLSAEDGVLEAIRALKQTVPEAFVLVSLSLIHIFSLTGIRAFFARMVRILRSRSSMRRASFKICWIV